MVFFLNAEAKVYARYGGRDADNADQRQSLAGLKYTMESVFRMHDRTEKRFAPQTEKSPQYIRDIPGSRRSGRCMHCHEVKEALNADLQKTGHWSRDNVWRYPLPDNL